MSQPPPTQAGQGQACDERPVEDPEGALLLRFAQGDPHVAAELTRRLAPRALGVAMRVLGNRAEAEDITQEAMVRLWRQAVVLRHIEDLPNPEIAGIMDISVEAVESLTARGKRALAAILAGRRAELGYSDG